ncbi:MAG: hypothetical protein NVS1B12_02540 [Acidimicrobiales bacterium]
MTKQPSSDTPRLGQAREDRKGVRAAFDRLERAASRPASDRTREWCDAFGARLTELRAAFAHHVEVTEADDGLFAEIIAAAPRLAHRTDELRQDHRDIEQAIDRAAARLETDPRPDHKAVVHARDAALDLLTRIARHRHLGAELVYDAYNVDIEAAD